MSDPLSDLRETLNSLPGGNPYDRIDVDKFMCWNRHDDGCDCTGAPVWTEDDYRLPEADQ